VLVAGYIRPTVGRHGRYQSTLALKPLQAGIGPKITFDPATFELPSEQVLEAVQKAGGRVTVTDVAATAGIDIPSARQGLVTLAAKTEATLEVSSDGEIVYSFSNDFRSRLRQESSAQKVRELYGQIKPILDYLIRISFGSLLFLSLFVVFSSIIMISSSSSSNDDDRRERRSGGGFSGGMGMGNWFGPSPFDFFYYRPYYGYYYDDYYGRSQGNPENMGFLEAIFSYVFGDGDPNAGFEEQQMQIVAQVIRSAGCAVTAEQLAPYLNPPPLNRQQDVNVKESFMLPVLTRFNGEPQVTEDGDIIYVFPELQTSALSSPNTRLVRELESMSARDVKGLLMKEKIPTGDIFEKKDLIDRFADFMTRKSSGSYSKDIAPFLSEREIPFSVAGSLKIVLAGILGVLNLGGALYLGFLFGQYPAGFQLPGLVGFAQTIYPLLFGYAVAFNLLPAWRYFKLQRANTEILERNENRQRYAQALGTASGFLLKKIKAAQEQARNVKTIQESDILYSTNRDISDQPAEQKARMDDDFSEFDKRLNG